MITCLQREGICEGDSNTMFAKRRDLQTILILPRKAWRLYDVSRSPHPSCSGGRMSDRTANGMFCTTELVSAFSTVPARYIVKLFAHACTIHSTLLSALSRFLVSAGTAHGSSCQAGTAHGSSVRQALLMVKGSQPCICAAAHMGKMGPIAGLS